LPGELAMKSGCNALASNPVTRLVSTQLAKLAAIVLFALAPSMLPSMTMAADGKLTFSTFSFPPFSYAKDGKVAGPFVDIIDAVCKEIRYQCSYEFVPNLRSKMEFENGDVNGNFPLGWNKERDTWIWFTVPLMKTEYGFFARGDSQVKYHSLKDIEDLTVGVFGPSNTSNSLTEIQKKMTAEGLKPIRIELHPNADGTGFKKVVAGRYPLYYVNKDVGFQVIAQENIENVKYIGTEEELLYFAGFNKKYNDKRNIDTFNRAAIKIANQGVIAKLLEKYHIAPGQWDDETLKKYNIDLGSVTQ
jgi:polar amino acid transport system substrate-binding protein